MANMASGDDVAIKDTLARTLWNYVCVHMTTILFNTICYILFTIESDNAGMHANDTERDRDNDRDSDRDSDRGKDTQFH